MSARISLLGAPSDLPDVARMARGWGLSMTAGYVCQVAMLVWAFTGGGPGLVAVYGIATTVPGAVATPLITSLCVRMRSDRMLRSLLWLRAGLLALAALTVAMQASPVAVILLVVGDAALAGSYRPIQAASVPWLVHTPAQLSAANVRATLMGNAAGLIGPILGGALLAVTGPGATLAVAAATMTLAACAVLFLRTHAPSPDLRGGSHLTADLVAGARSLMTVISPGGAVVMAFVQTFVRGLLLVLTVVLALNVLSLAQDSVGWLTAAMGFGGLLGGTIAGRVLRTTRLARCFAAGIALWGLPLVVLAIWPTTGTAYAALFVVGVGNALVDGAAYTLIPRMVGQRLAPAALGALEVVAFAGIGLGAAVAPRLSHLPGTLPALMVGGSLLVLLAAGYLPQCIRIDRSAPEPGPDLSLVQDFSVFQPLPVVTIEELLLAARTEVFEDGEPVVIQGHSGDTFYLIASGAAEVTVDGEPRPALHRGDGFGEIALLHAEMRTATVVASGTLQTLAFDRADFLSAVSGDPASAERAELLVADRMSRGRHP